jgi:hypothetical protein
MVWGAASLLNGLGEAWEGSGEACGLLGDGLSAWLVAIGALFSQQHGHRGKSSFFHQIIF